MNAAGANPEVRRAAGRRRHLERLWGDFTAASGWPQLDRWLSTRLRAERSFGRRDRLWYADAIFNAVRFGYLALFCDHVAATGDAPACADAQLQGALERFAKAIPGPADAVQALRRMPFGRLRAWTELRSGAGSADLPDRDLAWWHAVRACCAGAGDMRLRMLWNGIPLWFAPHLERRIARSGWDTAHAGLFLDRHATRPPVWLRLNDPNARERVLAELAGAGLRIEERDGAVAVTGEKGVAGLDCCRAGRVEIQDYASQRIGAAAELRRGDFVWDCCAGGGGKSLQLAAMLGNSGAVYASDIREGKLVELRRRAARAGFTNIRTFVADAAQAQCFGAAVARRGGFDWVVVDAPCTGSGTWRRNPDGKFREGPGGLGEVTAQQRRLLAGALSAVRPGGRVVYGTCSWLCEENEDLVLDTVAAERGCEIESMRMAGNPDIDSDSAFVCVIRRQGGPAPSAA